MPENDNSGWHYPDMSGDSVAPYQINIVDRKEPGAFFMKTEFDQMKFVSNLQLITCSLATGFSFLLLDHIGVQIIKGKLPESTEWTLLVVIFVPFVAFWIIYYLAWRNQKRQLDKIWDKETASVLSRD